MTGRALTDVTLAVRDAIYEGLLVRKGEVLTEDVCRERANNTCTRVIEALRDLAEAKARAAELEPPPVRPAPQTEETPQQHAERVIR